MNEQPLSLVENVRDLLACLEEAHQEEIETDHHGDGAEGCSYCAAIENAHAALARSEVVKACVGNIPVTIERREI